MFCLKARSFWIDLFAFDFVCFVLDISIYIYTCNTFLCNVSRQRRRQIHRGMCEKVINGIPPYHSSDWHVSFKSLTWVISIVRTNCLIINWGVRKCIEIRLFLLIGYITLKAAFCNLRSTVHTSVFRNCYCHIFFSVSVQKLKQDDNYVSEVLQICLQYTYCHFIVFTQFRILDKRQQCHASYPFFKYTQHDLTETQFVTSA